MASITSIIKRQRKLGLYGNKKQNPEDDYLHGSLRTMVSLIEFNHDCRYISINVEQTDLNFLTGQVIIPIYGSVYELQKKISEELHNGAISPEDVMIYLDKPLRSVEELTGLLKKGTEKDMILKHLRAEKDTRFIEYYIKNKLIDIKNGQDSNNIIPDPSFKVSHPSLSSPQVTQKSVPSTPPTKNKNTIEPSDSTGSLDKARESSMQNPSSTINYMNVLSEQQSSTESTKVTLGSDNPTEKKISTTFNPSTHNPNSLLSNSKTNEKVWNLKKLHEVLPNANMKSFWTVYYDVKCYSHPETNEKPLVLRTCPILMDLECLKKKK